MQATSHRRSSTYTATAPLSLQGFKSDLFSDSRFHGYQGPNRNVRLSRATTSGGGTIAKSEDGVRCVVAGRESLRILRLADPEETPVTELKSVVGRGGHRIESTRNFWDGSGLKIDSASTDVAWCSGNYNNKILTSARNGDLIMWDLNKSGSSKYERKTKNHIRSIHKLSCSSIVPYYCITGSADGDMRIWDLRDMSRSVMKIHHPTSVRSLVFSPSLSHPLQAIVGLDNGSIYRWDLQMGQRGQLDRLPVAHTGPILALDWCDTGTSKTGEMIGPQLDRSWIVSGGLDHTVKVWDLPGSNTSSHIANKPAYTLHPSFPVRRVLWRPDFPCELALVSNAEFSGTGAEILASPRMQNATPSFISTVNPVPESKDTEGRSGIVGDTLEIWDVRRGWIGKWTVDGSVSEGGATDAAFRDSHALLVQHASGGFAQIDLRFSYRPIDAIPRQGLSWNAVDGLDGALAFVADKKGRWEIPYDDVHPEKRLLFSDRKLRVKALGDEIRTPGLQNMGMYVHVPPTDDTGPEEFVRLAKGYVVPEKLAQRREVCALNAEIALQAGNIHAAQAWVLLESLLTDIVPESITNSISTASKSGQPHPLTHSTSAPPALPLNEGVSSHGSGLISKPTSHRAPSADSAVHMAQSPLPSPSQYRSGISQTHPQTPRSASINGSSPAVSVPDDERKHQRHVSETQQPPPTKPPPNSRNLTPVSSASSSPRHAPVSLPPTSVLPPTTTMTPTNVAARRPSIFVPTTPHTPRPSLYSRITSGHSESPSVASASISDKSLRHVGEGALDDSDSSEGAASDSVAESHVTGSEVDHAPVEVTPTPASAPPKPLMTKARSLSTGRAGPVHPSPLSRLAGQQQWTEDEEEDFKRPHDEDDEASPSPLSSDTDCEHEHSDEDSDAEVRRRSIVSVKTHPIARSRSRKNSNANARRVRSSRSSTVASLAAPLVSPAHSSPSRAPGSPQPRKQSANGPVVRRGSQSSVRTVIAASVREQENEAGLAGVENEVEVEPVSWVEMSHRQKVEVTEEESQLREAGWRALRDTLEEYADEGDVQMCAMLALVAPEELKVDLGRTIQFVEAYVDMLMRHRLHTCAAYLRKFCQLEEVQKTTRLETIVYTACRKCRKPIMTVRSRNPFMKSTHSVCTNCKEAAARCSICHLPVRTLLFQCSICSHGGHQECYRRYYMERPMVELPVSSITRGRQLQRDGEIEAEEGRGGLERVRERSLAGHPCAAGCGHFCWAAVGQKSYDRNMSPNIESRMQSSSR